MNIIQPAEGRVGACLGVWRYADGTGGRPEASPPPPPTRAGQGGGYVRKLYGGGYPVCD